MMRRFIVNIIAEHLCAGHAATIMCATDVGVNLARHRVKNALADLGVKFEDSKLNNLILDNGAYVQFGQLHTFTGAAMVHTPLVVLVDVDKANQVLMPDARAVACCFPNGKRPILIEC